MLNNAFEALKKYDWGTDLAVLAPIEEAVAAARGAAGDNSDLENHLVAALRENLSRDAQDYVCRKLAIVGTASAVPVLAGLLANPASSHMARYALERITSPEAVRVLHDALEKVGGKLKIGVISSLGARRDAASVAALAKLLRDNDPATARAAALALGTIGSPQAGAALQAALPAAGANNQAVIDGLLSYAEALLTSRQNGEALAIYKSLADGKQGRLVRLAATRGVLACTANQNSA